jgi:uncharacterized membrane protein
MILLLIIFITLLIAIGGERGIKSLVSIFLNILILSGLLIFITWRFHPLILTFLASLLISNVTLFYQNGKNAKTLASFFSVILVVVLLIGLTYVLGYEAKIGGLSEMIADEALSFGISTDIHINMFYIAIAMIITGLMGAAMDTSIAISSAVYEVYRNNRQLNRKDLYQSGIQIGKDILGTTINTLYFAYIGGGMSLFILYKKFQYSLLEIINSKAFFQDTIYIILSGISCVMIIPITAGAIAYIVTHAEKFMKHLDEDEIFNN